MTKMLFPAVQWRSGASVPWHNKSILLCDGTSCKETLRICNKNKFSARVHSDYGRPGGSARDTLNASPPKRSRGQCDVVACVRVRGRAGASVPAPRGPPCTTAVRPCPVPVCALAPESVWVSVWPRPRGLGHAYRPAVPGRWRLRLPANR